MKTVYFFGILFCFSLTAKAQQHVYIHFVPKVEGNTLAPQAVVHDLQSNAFSVDFFNYYLSNLHLIHDGTQDLDLSDTVFLVKMTDNILDLGMLDVTTITDVNFGVGVPQALNHLDISQYPANHPLSFQSPSMQWGWNAGYAHMIVDGHADSNGDGVPDAAFELHNLGDANYQYVTLTSVDAVTSSNQIDIYINCNLDQWLFSMNLGSVGVVHGSGQINTIVMTNVSHKPVFTSPVSAGIKSISTSVGVLTVINNSNTVTVKWSEMTDASSYSLIDVNGRMIQKGIVSEEKQGQIALDELSAGTYIFTLYNSSADQLNQVRFIK